MSSFWMMGRALNPKTCVLRRDTQERHTQRRRPREDEAETGVMQPQAEEGLGPPAAGRGKAGLSPRAFRGNTALPAP